MVETRVFCNLIGLASGITTLYFLANLDYRACLTAFMTYVFFKTAIRVEMKRRSLTN